MMARSDTMPGPRMGMMRGGMMGQGMMQMMRGMHQRMMQNPMHRSSMMAFTLPALADTLGLSDQQVSQLEELRSNMTDQRQEHREQMRAQRTEFMSLFEGKERPSPDEVRQHLMDMAEMRALQQASVYETAEQMREVLTDEQRQTIASLTPQQRMRQMMAHMPMMDMMQMMRSMHRGMMGQGMMLGGMMKNMPMRPGGMMRQGGMQNMPRQQNDQNR